MHVDINNFLSINEIAAMPKRNKTNQGITKTKSSINTNRVEYKVGLQQNRTSNKFSKVLEEQYKSDSSLDFSLFLRMKAPASAAEIVVWFSLLSLVFGVIPVVNGAKEKATLEDKLPTNKQIQFDNTQQCSAAVAIPKAVSTSSICKVGFFPVKRHILSEMPKNNLLTQIAQLKITLPEIYKKQIPKRSLTSVNKEVEMQIARVRSVLPETINPERLSKVLSDPSFSIEITPKVGLPPAGKGQYIPVLNTILIRGDGLLTEGCLRTTLANELYHASVRARNREIVSGNALTVDEMTYPFFSKNKAQKLEFDESKLNRVVKAINFAKKRIDGLEELLFKAEAVWTENERIKWEEYQRAFSDYRQIEFCQEVPASYLNEDEFITIRSSEKGSSDASKFEASTWGDGKTSKEKMMSFWLEWQVFLYNIENLDVYKILPDKGKLNDLLSFIEEFPSGVKKFFFKELCDYLSEYMGTRGNYCEIKTLSM